MSLGVRGQLDASATAIRSVVRNRELASLELGLAASGAADWAYVVAVMLVAYRTDGVAAVGGVGVARMLVATASAPLVSGLTGRIPARTLLVASAILRIAVIAAAAAIVAAGGPPIVLLGAVAVEAGAFAVVRPLGASLFPALARSPGELVAANLAASAGENGGTLVGPLLGGLAFASAGPAAASALAIALLLAALLGVAALQVRREGSEKPRPADAAVLARLREGAVLLAARAAPRTVVGVFFAQVIVRGILNVLLVVASIELLGLGESGVGLLTSAIGLGGFVGALGATMLVGRPRLGGPFGLAAVGWGLPIAVIALAPHPLVAVTALAVLGAANALLDISGFTLLQRTVPNADRAAVFGLTEGVAGVGLALGSMVGPVLVIALGPIWALAVTGAILPIVVVFVRRGLARADLDAIVPDRQLAVLRGQPMFAPLPMTVLERMAEGMVLATFPTGELLTVQGEAGDRLFLIETGEVEVERDGILLRRLGPNGAVGEIALLRHVPRTATVRATAPTTTFALCGDDFIAAISARPDSVAAADAIVAERLVGT